MIYVQQFGRGDLPNRLLPKSNHFRDMAKANRLLPKSNLLGYRTEVSLYLLPRGYRIEADLHPLLLRDMAKAS
jgi:hypothetical protein